MSTTPHVQYAYADGSANTIRPTGITYPNGRVLTYAYGTAGGINDALSRICSLIDNDGSTHLADYSYLGQSAIVEVTEPEPDLKYTLVGTQGGNDPDTGDIYRGLDRFGRVKDLVWYNTGSSTDAARIQHGYDRASNRLWRQDPVAASNGKAFDELYTYDGLYRLQDMQRGTLNGTHTAINTGTETFAQCWTLDSTGNWNGMKQADTGGAWSLEQARTANPVNEITAITNSTGPTWAQPVYDPAGNMTTVPRTADPTLGYTATYDAWNRLVKLADQTDTVATYAYDGQFWRTRAGKYVNGTLDSTIHSYYSSDWQVLEERPSDTFTLVDRQFVWGLRYIDDCLLRDRDTTSTGTLDERLYALQDPNWNVIALADDNGAVQERYAYSAYGVPEVLTAAFAVRSGSSYDWETTYAGYRWDSHVGLYHIRHRTYSPELGVWMQRDPKDGDNDGLYCYVEGNSILYNDPLGLAKKGQEWMFHPIDHGGPHFQIKIRGKQCRYRATTLEPLPHLGHTPQPLSKTQIKVLRASPAWRSWLTHLSRGGALAVATIGYDQYLEAGQAIGEHLATQVGLCRKVQVAISQEGNEYSGKAAFKIQASGISYNILIVKSSGACWVTASHTEKHFSMCLLDTYSESIQDIEVGECPAVFRTGCECRE